MFTAIKGWFKKVVGKTTKADTEYTDKRIANLYTQITRLSERISELKTSIDYFYEKESNLEGRIRNLEKVSQIIEGWDASRREILSLEALAVKKRCENLDLESEEAHLRIALLRKQLGN